MTCAHRRGTIFERALETECNWNWKAHEKKKWNYKLLWIRWLAGLLWLLYLFLYRRCWWRIFVGAPSASELDGLEWNYCYANDWRRHFAASAQLHRKHNWIKLNERVCVCPLPATFSTFSARTIDPWCRTQHTPIEQHSSEYAPIEFVHFAVLNFKFPTTKKRNGTLSSAIT